MVKNKKHKPLCVKIEGIPEVSMEELIEGCTRDIEMYLKRFDKFHSFYAISLSMALVPFAILVTRHFGMSTLSPEFPISGCCMSALLFACLACYVTDICLKALRTHQL